MSRGHIVRRGKRERVNPGAPLPFSLGVLRARMAKLISMVVLLYPTFEFSLGAGVL